MDWSTAALITPPSLPMMATIYGGPKVGKTELEATFPGLIIMAWEHPGPTISGRTDIVMTPIIQNYEDGLSFLRWLYANPGDFKTLGVDTITKMNKVFEAEIIKNSDAQGMGDALGGYGKAYTALTEMHRKYLLAFEALRRDKGFNIVFVAHAEVGKFNRPDGEPYNYYKVDMNEKSEVHYLNNSDVIGYLDLKVMIKETKDKKIQAVTSNQRVLKVNTSASHVSGNRYGITEDLIVEKGVNPLAQYLTASRVEDKREGTF